MTGLRQAVTRMPAENDAAARPGQCAGRTASGGGVSQALPVDGNSRRWAAAAAAAFFRLAAFPNRRDARSRVQNPPSIIAPHWWQRGSVGGVGQSR